MVQKMLEVERKLKVKHDELAESQPTEEINQLKGQLASREEELNQFKQVGNKRQNMVQHMLGVETKLKAQIVLLQVQINQKNRALEESNEVDVLQPQKEGTKDIDNLQKKIDDLNAKLQNSKDTGNKRQ